jgi:hypothetical protein
MRDAIKRWLAADNPTAKTLNLPAVSGFEQIDKVFDSNPAMIALMIIQRLRHLRDHLNLEFDPELGLGQMMLFSYNRQALPFMMLGNDLLFEYFAEVDEQRRKAKSAT